MPVVTPADKRFRRAHVSPTRKRSWRAPSWRVLARALALVAAALGGVWFVATRVLSAETLTVTRVTVEGNAFVSRGEVLSRLQGLEGESMVTVDLAAWREKLLESPWVADAALRRVLPGTVAVLVAERQPIALARVNGGLHLIDERGVVIDEYGPAYAEFDLPMVNGLTARPGDRGHEARVALASRVLTALRAAPDLASQVSEIDVANPGDATVMLKRDTAVVHVGSDRFVERLQSYLEIAGALREREPNIDYVDMRFDGPVYVRPYDRRPGVAAAGLTVR